MKSMKMILSMLLLATALSSCSPSTANQDEPLNTGTNTASTTYTMKTTETTIQPVQEETPAPVYAQVVRVIDGDTIEVSIDGFTYPVRYIGIDAPETPYSYTGAEAFEQEATNKNRELVEGKTVRLEKDVSDMDRYGRLLRYVFADTVFVNAELVRLGYARATAYPPDTAYQDYFSRLQEEAQYNDRGIWSSRAETSSAEAETPAPETPVIINVQITSIFYDGLVPSSEADEYVEITNLGSESVNLAGWKLIDADEGYPSFTFPAYELPPGGNVRVYTNEIHPEYGGFSFDYGKAVWNNSNPDLAVLYNAQGTLVSSKSY